MKENLIFHSYDELKLMLGYQIRIRLDPDLFYRIRILQAAVMIAIQLESKLWQIWWIRDPWFNIYGSTAQWTVALQRPIFKRKKGFVNLSLGLICYSIASSQPPSRDTVPLKQYNERDWQLGKPPYNYVIVGSSCVLLNTNEPIVHRVSAIHDCLHLWVTRYSGSLITKKYPDSRCQKIKS
jgi:hypothetical protein